MSDDEKSSENAAAESAQRRPQVDTEGLSENAARLAGKAMPGDAEGEKQHQQGEKRQSEDDDRG